MKTFATLGHRQQDLLKTLLANPDGQTVDQLRQALAISRNAVIQHLQSLERLELVEQAMGRQSIGRPGKVYFLSPAGRELFPRHYSLFSNLLLRGLRDKYGDEGLQDFLHELGNDMARQFKDRVDARAGLEEKIGEVSLIMQELGYETAAATGSEGDERESGTIIASNCVFHKLAQECPAVCQLDLALMETLVGAPVRHEECMVRGGGCCKFRFAVEVE